MIKYSIPLSAEAKQKYSYLNCLSQEVKMIKRKLELASMREKHAKDEFWEYVYESVGMGTIEKEAQWTYDSSANDVHTDVSDDKKFCGSFDKYIVPKPYFSWESEDSRVGGSDDE